VSVEVPLATVFELHGARPNPAVGVPMVDFTLDRTGEVRLELLDIAGRMAGSRTAVLEPGRHLLPLAMARSIAPGVYLVRITHSGRTATTRVVLAR
jgi:hypothetical protein